MDWACCRVEAYKSSKLKEVRWLRSKVNTEPLLTTESLSAASDKGYIGRGSSRMAEKAFLTTENNELRV